MGRPRKTYAGVRAGALTAIRDLPEVGKRGHSLVEAQCDCGAIFVRNGCTLRPDAQFNGCKECVEKKRGQASITHGMTYSPTYKSWQRMRARCLYPSNNRYSKYGGRGIKVCDRWLDSFANFLEDMGPRPPGASIDRIDNDGDYEPGNCRWSSMFTQQQNTSRTRLVEIDGKSKTISEWSLLSGIAYKTIFARLDNGWPAKLAVFEPLKRNRK